MKIAQLPINERERLKALNDYYILDTLPENDFEDIETIASAICNMPSVSVCLFDAEKHWVKCKNESITPALLTDFIIHNHIPDSEVVIIPDITVAENYKQNNVVKGNYDIRFFAQIPLYNYLNNVIGAICIISKAQAHLNEAQINALMALAKQLVCQLEQRKKIADLKELQAEQKIAYSDLEKFSFVASHDLRSPLNNIISLTQLLKEDYASQLDEDGKEYIGFLNSAALQLADLVSGILDYSRSSQILTDNKEEINIPELIKEVISLLHAPDNIIINYSINDNYIYTSRIAMKQILLNLCDNAIKHNDKPLGIIDIKVEEGKKYLTFEVKDNGPGIEPADQRRIFELFERVKKQAKDKGGIGIGLSIVKRLVEKLGGDIKISSTLGNGTAFIFTIEK